MRSIRITLYTENPVTLPLAYNELQQGLLYSCWQKTFPELHDNGFSAGGKIYRMFVFGPLQGKCNPDGKTKTIRFEGAVSFEVRSPFEELLDALAYALAEKESIQLGAHRFQLTNLQSIDRLLFPTRSIIQTLSPVTVHETLDDGKTRYFAPGEPEWINLIQGNAARKAETLNLGCDPTIQIIPLGGRARKQVTRFKGFYITGWTGQFAISGDPQIISALYHTGLGSKNSQGFGMFDIMDKSL